MPTKWSIRTKLLIGLGLLGVIVATLSWGGIRGLYAYRALVRSLSRRVTELPLANQFSSSVGELRSAWQDGLSRENTGARLTGGGGRGRREFAERLAAAREALSRYNSRLRDNQDFTDRISDYHLESESVQQMQDALDRVAAKTATVDWLVDARLQQVLTRDLDRLRELSAELPTYLHRQIIDFSEHAKGQYRALIVLAWITSGTTLVLVVLMVQLFYRWLFRPLRILIKGSRKVASGQFQYRIKLQTQDEMSELAAAMNDMTARFQAIRDDLDRQVQERTQQIVRSEQLASVGFLAAGVAHEINNPLASIAISAESLEGRLAELEIDSPTMAVAKRYLRLIQDEAFRCKEITEKLLDFSRLGNVKRLPADLRPVIESVIEMLGHLGKYQGKYVEFAAGAGVVARVHGQEIKQVVLNLLTNALESVEDGGRVRVELADRDGQAEIRVADNGCGMTPEVLKHLFEPFFTRRRVGQGTGLGLSITYRIVADHGGTIEAASAGENRGSEICVRLPLAAASQEVRHDCQAA